MEFTKYHGLGNDFVFVEDFDNRSVRFGKEWAPMICNRNFGIGADGLVFITKPDDVYTMRIFNSDGSEAEMCGNAIRCVARHLWDGQLVTGDTVIVGTFEGTKEIRRENGAYTVNMGRPQWNPASIPTTAQPDVFHLISINAGGETFRAMPLSMGNPHAVIVVDDIETIPFGVWGPALETHHAFPAKSNIEFVQMVDREHVRVKVWERGVGPTLACGTGACASVAATARLGLTGRSVKVELPGGVLQIRWDQDDFLWMTGPADRVFSGRWEAALV